MLRPCLATNDGLAGGEHRAQRRRGGRRARRRRGVDDEARRRESARAAPSRAPPTCRCAASAARRISKDPKARSRHPPLSGELLRHQRQLFEQLAESGQKPETLFITCCDSRVVPNLITNTAPASSSSVRNIGNIVPSVRAACIGGVSARSSMRSRCSRSRNVIVCGHTQCGAIDAILHPERVAHLPFVVALARRRRRHPAAHRGALRQPRRRGAHDRGRRGERPRPAREPPLVRLRRAPPRRGEAQDERLGLQDSRRARCSTTTRRGDSSSSSPPNASGAPSQRAAAAGRALAFSTSARRAARVVRRALTRLIDVAGAGVAIKVRAMHVLRALLFVSIAACGSTAPRVSSFSGHNDETSDIVRRPASARRRRARLRRGLRGERARRGVSDGAPRGHESDRRRRRAAPLVRHVCRVRGRNRRARRRQGLRASRLPATEHARPVRVAAQDRRAFPVKRPLARSSSITSFCSVMCAADCRLPRPRIKSSLRAST